MAQLASVCVEGGGGGGGCAHALHTLIKKSIRLSTGMAN